VGVQVALWRAEFSDPVGSCRTTDLEEYEVKAGLKQFEQSTASAKAGSTVRHREIIVGTAQIGTILTYASVRR
jgi:hypothetical protein